MDINLNSAVSQASNLIAGLNPVYEINDFTADYPQFGANLNSEYLVPVPIIEMYIGLADACIKESRWHSSWKIAMGLFVAHFCTLHLQGTSDPNSGAGVAIAAGQARGLITSKSVGDVSQSIDYSGIGNDLEGWAAWKLTIYGTQLATIGKLLGRAGMYIY